MRESAKLYFPGQYLVLYFPLGSCVNVLDGGGAGYIGTVSVTETGIKCQDWSETTPHDHGYYTEDNRLNKGLGQHNYCRNPSAGTMPWCYTSDPAKRWEYCDIPLCTGNTF